MVLRNVGITQHYTASKPRRPRPETSPTVKASRLETLEQPFSFAPAQ